MAEEYLDSNGNELKTGWYRHRDGKLYFIEQVEKGVLLSSAFTRNIRISSNSPMYFNPSNLLPTNPTEDKENAQAKIDFINKKQSELEQLSQSEKSKETARPFSEINSLAGFSGNEDLF